jgi:hypothetical protein
MNTMEDRMSRVERMLEEMAENNLAMQGGYRVLEAQTVAFREEIRQAQRTWGELANKMGTLVEDIVAPGIPAVFQAVFGWATFDATIQRMRRRHRTDSGRTREFDYVVVTRDVVLITQTKRTLRPDDLDEMLAVLHDAREYLPEYQDRPLVGALASFSVDPSLVVAGERRGLLMFGLGTGLLRLLNTPGFQPARF